MQANIKRSVLSRLISCVLAALMLVGLLPEQTLPAKAYGDTGDFELSLSWNKIEANCTDPNDPGRFVYDSDTEETRLARLKVAYSNKQVSRAFEAGEITITVPGLKGAVRSGNSYIPTIAADKASSEIKQYDWSYSYTEATDTYTFTYNKDIQANSTFEGSFELVWKLPSRETVDGFEGELTAELFTSDVNVVSNTLTYTQTRKRDEYTVKEDASPLYDETLPIDDHQKYIWVKYDISGSDTYLARDIKDSETFELYFLEDAEVYYLNGFISDSGKTETIDGKNYHIWTVTQNITNRSDPKYISDIFVAYPRDVYQQSPYYGYGENNELLHSIVKITGTYFDEEDKETLAEYDLGINLQNYDFSDVPGPIYNVEKSSYGIHMDSIDEHDDYCRNHGAINSINLSDGKGNYYSTFELELFYTVKAVTAVAGGGASSATEYQPADSYRLEFVDDIIDVQLKDGSLRQLRDDEYEFTNVFIPSNKEIENANGYYIKADTYNVEIYVRTAERDGDGELIKQCNNGVAAEGSEPRYNGNFDTTPVWTGKITKIGQMISLPKDTVGVKIVIYDVTESWFLDTISCQYKFHTDDDDIMTDGGQIINNMHFNLIGTKGDEELDPNYKQFGFKHYAENEGGTEANRQYQRDMEIYGHALDRESAVTHIIEIPNEFKLSSTRIELDRTVSENGDGFDNGAYYFNGSIFSKFELGEGTELSDFSIYTIVPKGLRLTENANDADSLLEAVSFYSSGGYSSAYIASHTSIEIIDDPLQYDGRQYIAFHFDFSDDPISTKTLDITGIPMYVFKHNLTQGSISYTMHSAMTVDQPGKWYSNGVDSNSMENGIWKDIDRDGDTSDLASFASGYVEIANEENFHMQLTKFVQTPFTNGMVNPKPEEVRDEDGKATAAAPKTYAGGEYSYFLYATVVSGVADQVIFADVIEPDSLSEWQGKFVGVDYSQITKQLEYPNGAKKEPTIYYSSNEEVFTKTVDEKTLIDRDCFEVGGWTTEKPDVVRSIAVDFGEGQIRSGMNMVLEIKMKAPTDVSNQYKLATNSCSIGYNWIENTSGNSSNHPDYLSSNTVPVTYVPAGKIILTKKDEVTDVNITGAKFELYKETAGEKDTLIGEYETNGNGIITVDCLAYGTYYFVETEAPAGYVKSDGKFYVTVSEDDPTQRVDFENERKKGQFTLTKVSDRTKQKLSGAEFELYNADGTRADEKIYVTDASGELTVKNLAWGKYYLMESKAPKGYELSEEKIEFEINAETAENPEGKTVENEQKPAKATLVKRELGEGHEYEEVTESSQIGDAAIKGAIYRLYDSDGNQISTGVTDADGKIYAEDLTFGDYYFEEAVAALGYEKYPQRIEFTVGADETEKALVIDTADSRRTGSVWLQKLDDEKKSVNGATYRLYDGEGKLLTVDKVNPKKDDGKYRYVSDGKGGCVDMVTSSEGIIEIEEMYWGDYYIKEEKAPMGYRLDEIEHEFTIDKNNVASTVMIYSTDPRIKGKVELTKVDEGDKSKLLGGAVFTLYRNDGTVYRENITTDNNRYLVNADGAFIDENGNVVSENDKVENPMYGKVLIEDLEWGDYYLNEKTAPDGYSISPKNIKFSVGNKATYQTYTVTNPKKNYKLTVTKKISQADIVLAHGNPTFTFEVENSADNQKYYKTVSFGSNNIVQGGEGYAEASVVFALPMGTYDITETSVDRYRPDSIEVNNGSVNGITATVTLDDNNPKDGVVVTFKNDKTNQSGTSHNSAVANMFGKSRILTAIVAEYIGPKTVTAATIPPEDLVVTAVYDDGTQMPVTNYTLEPKELSFENNGSFNITVSYTENEITQKDTFSVTVDLPSPFTAQFVTKNADGTYSNSNTPEKFTDTDGTEYDGLVKITGYIGDSSIINFPSALTGYIWTGRTNEDQTYSGKKFKVVGIENLYPSDTATVYVKNGETEVKGISFAEGIEYIGPGAFRGFTGLTCKLELPSTLKSIGYHAFWGDPFIGDLVIPEGVTSIGEQAFQSYGINSFNGGTLTLPDTLKTIGRQAFYDCEFTGNLNIPDSVETIGDRAFIYCDNFNGKLHLPDNPKFKTIEKSTFEQCKNLTGSLQIPASVETIGDYAFMSCNGFTGSLQIPASVETIGNYAFMSCNGFDGYLTFGTGSKLKTIGDYAFAANGWAGDAPKFIGALTLPDNVEIIGDHAFFTCRSFNGNLTLPSNLKQIKSWAFYGCTNLQSESLYIPDTVKVLGDRAFANCSSLSGNLHLTENIEVTAIGMNTFYNCKNLSGTLTIPSNIKKIGYGAFWKCTGFTGLELKEGLEEISVSISGENFEGSGSFQGCTGFSNDLTIPASVTIIGQYAFSGCTGFNNNELTIPINITEINDNAFHGCSGFKGKTLIIPKDNCLTVIGKNAFNACYFNNDNSMIWIAMDSNADKTFVKSDGSTFTREVNKTYYYSDSTPNIDSGVLSTSKTTVGSDVFWGYQPHYGFFERTN